LKFSSVLGVIFAILAIFTSGYTSVLFIALLGLANAIMWPAIWPLTIHGLGRFTKVGSALLVVGIAGGAILPKLWATIGEVYGYQEAFWIMVPCYVYILYFAISGHKVGVKSKKETASATA
jgi:fucose permease